jgi:hypothetical protein
MKLQSEHEFTRAGGHQKLVKGRCFSVAETAQNLLGRQPLLNRTLHALWAAFKSALSYLKIKDLREKSAIQIIAELLQFWELKAFRG